MSNATLDAPSLTELGSWDASEASTDRIYSGDGVSISGRSARRRALNEARRAQHDADVAEVMGLYQRVQNGDRRAELVFRENLSTSDFSNLFGDVIDRILLAKYVSQPVQWDMIAKRTTVRDFRTVKRFTLDGGEAYLPEVKQLAEYPAVSLADAAYSYSVKKYGRRIGLSWEDMVNDDLDAFRSIPDRLANAARRSEERFVTDLYVGTTGPDGTYFSSGNKNITTTGTANPPLSVAGLQAAFTVLASQLDADGAPIYIDGVTLVVPPALQVTALNIINATEIRTATGSGGAVSDAGRQDQIVAANWMANKVKLSVNPWLPLISTTNGNTSWYLFSDPNQGRPGIEVGFLAGHEQPELTVKSPNASRIGGGSVMAEDGDFENDGVEYRARHVFGGTLLDPKAAFGSSGAGS